MRCCILGIKSLYIVQPKQLRQLFRVQPNQSEKVGLGYLFYHLLIIALLSDVQSVPHIPQTAKSVYKYVCAPFIIEPSELVALPCLLLLTNYWYC